jgi:hypothetical protein
MPQDQTALTNLRPTPFGPTVMLPHSTNIQATHSGQKPLLQHSFSAKAKTAHVLDGITNASLISIGQLCDDDCVAVLDKKKLLRFSKTRNAFCRATATLLMDYGTSLSLHPALSPHVFRHPVSNSMLSFEKTFPKRILSSISTVAVGAMYSLPGKKQ